MGYWDANTEGKYWVDDPNKGPKRIQWASTTQGTPYDNGGYAPGQTKTLSDADWSAIQSSLTPDKGFDSAFTGREGRMQGLRDDLAMFNEVLGSKVTDISVVPGTNYTLMKAKFADGTQKLLSTVGHGPGKPNYVADMNTPAWTVIGNTDQFGFAPIDTPIPKVGSVTYNSGFGPDISNLLTHLALPAVGSMYAAGTFDGLLDGMFGPAAGSTVGPATGSIVSPGIPVANPYAGMTITDLAGGALTGGALAGGDGLLSGVATAPTSLLQQFADAGIGPQMSYDPSLGISGATGFASYSPELQAAIMTEPGLLDSVISYMKSNPGSTIQTALSALSGSRLLSSGMNVLGGYLSGKAAQDAATTAANAQLEAAKIAAEAAKFRPIGITTRFGTSQFQKDADGNVIGAGYSLTPDVKAQQDALMAQSEQMLSQYRNAPDAFAPMGIAGQRAMNLGNQYLATDPQAQALKYMLDQQALLSTGRDRDMSQMLSGEFNRGTYGLATGATGMMGAANPRLEALMNAQRQQDLGLAANATQGGMDYAKFGAGMVDVGGALTRGMYQGQTAAYDPYKTALGGAQTLEGLGQNALDLGVNMGKVTNNAQAGMLLASGMNAAAKTQQDAAYSPWGTALMGGANALNTLQSQEQAQQQQQLNNQLMLAMLGNQNSGGRL